MHAEAASAYYASRASEIRATYTAHARAWQPFLAGTFGRAFTEAIVAEARERHDALIPQIPYIGGDGNPMTRHLVRSTTSLALYLAMRAKGKSALQTGKVVYDAVVASVAALPALPPTDLTPEFIASERRQALESRRRRYEADWVWDFVLGDGVEFDYGYDFFRCATLRLYHAHDAQEFLRFYCYLDLATHRTAGWAFSRSLTLSEGHDRCAFRYKKGGETKRGWPPPFAERQT